MCFCGDPIVLNTVWGVFTACTDCRAYFPVEWLWDDEPRSCAKVWNKYNGGMNEKELHKPALHLAASAQAVTTERDFCSLYVAGRFTYHSMKIWRSELILEMPHSSR